MPQIISSLQAGRNINKKELYDTLQYQLIKTDVSDYALTFWHQSFTFKF